MLMTYDKVSKVTIAGVHTALTADRWPESAHEYTQTGSYKQQVAYTHTMYALAIPGTQ